MALWNCWGGGGLTVDSGSWSGVGGRSRGILRPLGPSGDDCSEMVEGLAVEEVPLGVYAVGGVTVNGTEVLICCLIALCLEW